MTTIITRAGKGAPLTNNEMDQNLINLNTDKAEVSDVTAGLALKANIDSPVLTGTPQAPTPNVLDNSTQIATTAFVKTNITNASTASSIVFNPVGGLQSNNVQDALAEVDAEKVPQTSGIGAAVMPTGPTADRPASPTEGHFRRNSQLKQWEGYDGSSWSGLGGASGGGGNPFVYENDITVTQNYTITTNKNGMSAGPITIANGITVTVPNGSVWSIV
jgi:hypothetical protein